MPIQDYMVDGNHRHFTNFNLKHFPVTILTGRNQKGEFALDENDENKDG